MVDFHLVNPLAAKEASSKKTRPYDFLLRSPVETGTQANPQQLSNVVMNFYLPWMWLKARANRMELQRDPSKNFFSFSGEGPEV